MNSFGFFRIFLAGAILVVATSSMAQTITLTVDSDEGDWVGQGQHLTFNYTPTDGGFYLNNRYYQPDGKPSFAEFGMGIPNHDPNTYATLMIGTDMLGTSLCEGTFKNAERAPFASSGHPGLDFTFQGHGSNTLTGQFTINSIHFVEVAGVNVIKDLDVDFEQHAEGLAPACFGHVVYNSGIVPEPITSVTLFVGVGILFRRKKKASISSSKTKEGTFRSPFGLPLKRGKVLA